MKGFVIDAREVPEEGRRFAGEIGNEIFELGDSDAAKPVAEVRYDCEASKVTGMLLVTGDFETAFELQCVRCLEKFRFPVRLAGHVLEQELENRPIADLTNTLREDILLALPAYPRCDEGPEARQCPAEGRFGNEDGYQPITDEEASEGRDVWGALDDLDKPSP